MIQPLQAADKIKCATVGVSPWGMGSHGFSAAALRFLSTSPSTSSFLLRTASLSQPATTFPRPAARCLPFPQRCLPFPAGDDLGPRDLAKSGTDARGHRTVTRGGRAREAAYFRHGAGATVVAVVAVVAIVAVVTAVSAVVEVTLSGSPLSRCRGKVCTEVLPQERVRRCAPQYKKGQYIFVTGY